MNLLKAASTVSLWTLASRVTGLLREILVANLFGASALTDAFNVAFRLPNMLRRFFAEGAFSQAFVPLLTESHATQTPAEQQRFVNAVATVLFWLLLLITTLGILAAPLLVWLMASGLQATGGFDAAVWMTRLMFPYIGLISLVAFAAGILNTFKRFAIPAATPVLLNVSVVAAGFSLSRYFDPPIYALAAGVVLGGVLQLAVQLPALARYALLPRISLNVRAAWRDDGVKQMIKRIVPATFAVSVAQVSLVINTHIASNMQAGSTTWISTADRLMEFPVALLGVALGVVLLPSLTRANTAGDAERFNELLNWGLRLVMLLALPCAVALAVFAKPLVAVLFFHGKFTAFDVQQAGLALSAYGVGLFGIIAVKVLAPGFYAKGDIKTPVKIAFVVLLWTQLFNVLFVPWLQHAALTLSIGLAALVNAALLYHGLRQKKSLVVSDGWTLFTIKIIASCSVMGAGLFYVSRAIAWLDLSLGVRACAMAGVIAVAALTYFGVLLLLGVRPQQFMKRM